jgi:hypothetical protein
LRAGPRVFESGFWRPSQHRIWLVHLVEHRVNHTTGRGPTLHGLNSRLLGRIYLLRKEPATGVDRRGFTTLDAVPAPALDLPAVARRQPRGSRHAISGRLAESQKCSKPGLAIVSADIGTPAGPQHSPRRTAAAPVFELLRRSSHCRSTAPLGWERRTGAHAGSGNQARSPGASTGGEPPPKRDLAPQSRCQCRMGAPAPRGCGQPLVRDGDLAKAGRDISHRDG